jgi:hypothetical protein
VRANTTAGCIIGGKKMQFFLYPRHQAGAIEVAVALFSVEGARRDARRQAYGAADPS